MESLSALIQSPLASTLAIGALGVLFFLLFWWRVGTIHTVLDRLWRLVFGKADAQDPSVKAILQERRDIERFNFTYRLKFETLGAIQKLESWRKQHDLGMPKIQRVRSWIDIQSEQIIRQPPKGYVKRKIVLACLAYLLAMFIVWLTTSPNAVLHMRASGVFFKTDALTVRGTFNGWAFNATDCSANKARIRSDSGLNPEEINSLCEALNTDSLKDVVSEEVRLQRRVGLIVWLVFTAYALVTLLAANSAASAALLRRQLYPYCSEKAGAK